MGIPLSSLDYLGLNNMAGQSLMHCFVLLLLLMFASAVKLPNAVGVNYGMLGNNLPPPKQVVELLKATYIDSVKLYNSDLEVLSAFANSGISLVIGVENELIPAMARSSRAATIWVSQHVLPFYPATSITAIVVGNEILTGTNYQNLNSLLLPAMLNLQRALQLYKLNDKIKVSTPNSMDVLQTSSPPSSAVFQPSLLPVMKQLLQFLSQTGSSFMVNAYPYFAYKDDLTHVPLDYALFQAAPGVKDPNTGFVYGSLFDAQVDAVYFAMSAAGYGGLVPVVVSETGWPSSGDADEVGATMQNAQIYNGNLVKRIASGVGTPLRPQSLVPTYIFALFNENQKPGPASERNFGLFNANAEAAYDAGLTREQEQAASMGGSGAGSSGAVWCVAGPGASEQELQQIINFACGEGGADCASIQSGQPCYQPDTLAAHASFAMNSYYQRHGRNYWNCFFNNTGLVTATNPSYGSCTYPSQ